MVTADASERRGVHIRLIHDGVQPGKPLEEPWLAHQNPPRWNRLGQIRAAGKPGKRLAADVIGRRPHTSEPVIWQVEAL